MICGKDMVELESMKKLTIEEFLTRYELFINDLELSEK